MNELIVNLQITDLKWINSLIVLSTFIIIAIIADIFIKQVLMRVAKLTKSNYDDQIINVSRMPVFITILFIGIISSANIFDFSDHTISVFEKISFSLIALFWSFAAFKISNILINNAIHKLFNIPELKKGIIPLIANIIKVVIIALTVFSILVIWKIDLTPLLASAGIASVILALAAKDTVGNLLGGISVFLDKPYQIGDYINLDSGERGEVVDIGMRSTRIKTRDDILISVPNAIIANTTIINESQPEPLFRCRIPIGVAYGSDIDLVEATLLEIALNHPHVVTSPEPRVRFREYADSSLNFELLCWVTEPALRGLTIHDLNKKLYKMFDQKKIRIPFPQRDVHFYKEGEDD